VTRCDIPPGIPKINLNLFSVPRITSKFSQVKFLWNFILSSDEKRRQKQHIHTIILQLRYCGIKIQVYITVYAYFSGQISSGLILGIPGLPNLNYQQEKQEVPFIDEENHIFIE
jgi:hypothetical protein